ncbi:hypothetical protein ACIPRD_15995 [Streptomyces sp. NPDC090108]|uniref:hypothetical protein n=1 Tax=Streptomyces sp. NPDC090108 TaxID=3365947 RepID=UPI0038282A43
MGEEIRKTVARPLSIVVAAAVAMAAWAAWLGWDQHRDVHPDGSTTGPYGAWQVAGLVLTLLVPVCWAAYRRRTAAAVLGVPAGLTVAALVDWSGDGDGLFVIGALLVLVGSLAATGLVAFLATSSRRREA